MLNGPGVTAPGPLFVLGTVCGHSSRNRWMHFRFELDEKQRNTPAHFVTDQVDTEHIVSYHGHMETELPDTTTLQLEERHVRALQEARSILMVEVYAEDRHRSEAIESTERARGRNEAHAAFMDGVARKYERWMQELIDTHDALEELSLAFHGAIATPITVEVPR